MSKVFNCLLVAAVALSSSGCSKGVGGAATPEAAFDAMKTAMRNKDYKSTISMLTPETQQMMVMAMTTVASYLAITLQDHGGELVAILKKYQFKLPENNPMVSPEDQQKAVEKAFEGVDVPAYFAELMTWLEKVTNDKNLLPTAAMEKSKLSDVKITGDTANGTVTSEHDGKPEAEPMNFKKINGKWLIEMTKGSGWVAYP